MNLLIYSFKVSFKSRAAHLCDDMVVYHDVLAQNCTQAEAKLLAHIAQRYSRRVYFQDEILMELVSDKVITIPYIME